MTQFQTREQRGIYVHVLPTNKYKINTIVATLTQELREETATPLALIPYVMMRGSEAYPTPEQLQLALDDLYGATLSGVIDKKGERHIIDFTMTVPNEKFLSTETDLFGKALGILTDVMLRPRTENGGFLASFVASEKEQQKKRIRAVLDDKIQYARERCLEAMTAGEPFAIPRLGREEELEAQTPQGLFELYRQTFKTAPMHIYVIGDVEPEEVADQIFAAFDLERDPLTEFAPVKTRHEGQGEREVIDRLDVNQGKLNIGIWTQVDYASDDYAAMMVCNGVLGVFPHSKLFMNVREKHSLAYYASSRLDAFKGLLYVQSGVEFDKMEQARKIIEEQVAELKAGRITDEEMSFTVDGFINSYKTSSDSPTSVADIHLNGLVGGRIRSAEELVEDLRGVTKDDVVRVAQFLQVDTVYMLLDQGGKNHA